ncbi:CopD family protein [Sanyastnella coralliicola]|uniref:CopD family protein n=1 Tax=Sanyastnella coralliicola TaxID=3069118 RepID=UPI0027B89D1F|nr:CopD family protein [Longitalea sp. SCSIO 12813]
MEFYDTYKALHIIFMVTWFAGLFYIVRLFIYHREANDKDDPERSILIGQFKIMERRLWYAITWPSAIICTLCGLTMLYFRPFLLEQGFMQVKLGFVAFLWLYQLYTHRVFKQLQTRPDVLNSIRLRFLNELPTLILISVVFLIIQRNAVDWIKGVVGIIGIALLFTFVIKRYQRMRK